MDFRFGGLLRPMLSYMFAFVLVYYIRLCGKGQGILKPGKHGNGRLSPTKRQAMKTIVSPYGNQVKG